jgi:hypothetical protein
LDIISCYTNTGSAKSLLQSYITSLAQYEIVPDAEKQLLENPTSSIRDPARRRELKIQQYKKEKDLRAEIEVWFTQLSGALGILKAPIPDFTQTSISGHNSH